MKVKFVPQNIEVEATSDKSILHLAQDNNLFIKSVCRGVPSCAECRVRVIEGQHNVVPPGSEELQLIGTAYFVDGRRLSCQVRCFGDVVIDLSEQVEKEKHLKDKKGHGSKSVREERAESTAVFGNLFEGFQSREERGEQPAGQERRPHGGQNQRGDSQGGGRGGRRNDNRNENRGDDRGGNRNDNRNDNRQGKPQQQNQARGPRNDQGSGQGNQDSGQRNQGTGQGGGQNNQGGNRNNRNRR